MTDRMGKKEVGVLRRLPVITRIDSFKGRSMSFVWALQHHTGAQYAAGPNASAKQEVLRALKEAPQPTPASHLISATRDETFFLSVFKCVLNDRERSKHMPRYDLSGSNFTVSLDCSLTFSWQLAACFFRWKTEHTVFSTESLSFHLVR